MGIEVEFAPEARDRKPDRIWPTTRNLRRGRSATIITRIRDAQAREREQRLPEAGQISPIRTILATHASQRSSCRRVAVRRFDFLPGHPDQENDLGTRGRRRVDRKDHGVHRVTLEGDMPSLEPLVVQPRCRCRLVRNQDLPPAAWDARCAAVFIASPRAVNSVDFSPDPTRPTKALPVWTPAPSGTHGPSADPMARRAQQFIGGLDRSPGMVLPRHEREEEADGLVTHEFLDDGVAADENVARHRVEAVHQSGEVPHREATGELARAADVGEEHG